jgi:hypothetical protein
MVADLDLPLAAVFSNVDLLLGGLSDINALSHPQPHVLRELRVGPV